MILHLSPRGETSQLSLEVIKFKSVCAKLMLFRLPQSLAQEIRSQASVTVKPQNEYKSYPFTCQLTPVSFRACIVDYLKNVYVLQCCIIVVFFIDKYIFCPIKRYVLV